MHLNSNNIEISTATIIKILTICTVAYVLYLLLDILFLILFSIILASAIRPAFLFLSKFKIPRVLSVILVYITFLLFLLVMIYSMIPIVQNQGAAFYAIIPDIIETTNAYSQGTVFETLITDLTVSFENSEIALGTAVGLKTFFSSFFSGVGNVLGGFVNVLLVAALTFLFSVEDKSLNICLKHLTPRKYQAYMFDLWSRAVTKIGAWFQGQLLLALIVGSIVFVGLTFLGVPNALFLSLFAAIFELIPVIGPIISIIPAFLVAITETTLYIAIAVIILFLLIQQLENQIILPLIISKLVGIPTVIVIISLVVGATLGGLLGLIISIPVTAIILEYIKDLESGKIWRFVQQYENEIKDKKIADA